MNNEKKDSDKLKNEVAEMEARIRGLREFINAPLEIAHLAANEMEPMKGESDDSPTYVANIETPKEAAVNHPPHYTVGGVECIDAIRSSMTDMEYQGYLKGNILKYLWRFRHKNGTEDLRKARWYLKYLWRFRHKNGTEDLRKARWYLDKLIEARGVI